LIGVGATASFGWLTFIAASFALTSVPDLLESTLALPMGQLFLDVLGKKGMLAIWSLIIVVQVSPSQTSSKKVKINKEPFFQFVTGAAQTVDASRVVFAFARDGALPGSRFWRQINPVTLTPVNAVWLVVCVAGVCGVLGFSEAALSSLAG
jgi:amino acid transporter